MRAPDSTEKCHTLWDSTVTAVCGLANALRYEKKVRRVFLAMLFSIITALVLKIGYFETFILVFAWVLSLICELFNTALEKAFDYAGGQEIHSLIRQGKDYGSACTFVSLVFASCLTIFLIVGR